MRGLVLLAALSAAFALPATLMAQRTGIIAGVVVDEAGNPIAGAEIAASGVTARATTDSAGKFMIRDLESGEYNVRARRIGYFPARMTADIGKGGRADLHIELQTRPAMLDSVIVTAEGRCPDRSYTGFLCRQRLSKSGVFLSDDDIFDKNARELGDIFRDVPGFRIETQPTIWGRLPMPMVVRGTGCLNALVNGKPASVTNPMPRFADQMIAAEIYATPAEVPQEYQRFIYGGEGRQTTVYHHGISSSDRCAIVVYWTRFN
jgi:hypothetical protein